MSSNYSSGLILEENETKNIVSINKSLNQNGEVIEIIISLDDGKEIYISSENDEALVINMI